MRDELSRSPSGRLVVGLWSEHRLEIRRLVDHNRRVATIWHRSGGPALLQALLRAMDSPALRLPAFINGAPVAACVDRIAGAFSKYGSPALRDDVLRVRSALPEIGGASFADIVVALGQG